MNPRKHKEFMIGIAEEMDVHPDVVEDIISFYFSKVRKTLSDLQYPYVNVKNLGTFYIRKGKLKDTIGRYKDIMGNLEKTTYDGFEKHIAVKEKLEQYESAMVILDRLQEEKEKFKKIKYGGKEL